MRVYVDIETLEVLSESAKEVLVWKMATELSEDEEFFEEFLKRYKRSELLKFGEADGIAVHLDFMNACRERAEEMFEDLHVIREVIN